MKVNGLGGYYIWFGCFCKDVIQGPHLTRPPKTSIPWLLHLTVAYIVTYSRNCSIFTYNLSLSTTADGASGVPWARKDAILDVVIDTITKIIRSFFYSSACNLTNYSLIITNSCIFFTLYLPLTYNRDRDFYTYFIHPYPTDTICTLSITFHVVTNYILLRLSECLDREKWIRCYFSSFLWIFKYCN
jgi:hypothetical protein